MATYTATTLTAGVRLADNRIFAQHGIFSGAITTGDVILLCKIPNMAAVIDGYLVAHQDTASTTASTVSGIQVTLGTLAISGDAANPIRFADLTIPPIGSGQKKYFNNGAGMGYRVSLSDNDTTGFAWVSAVVTRASLTSSSTISLELVLFYCDGRSGFNVTRTSAEPATY